METPEENKTVENKAPGAATPPKNGNSASKILGHVLLTGKSIPLHDGDVVITCAEPGFRRAGMAHPHMAIHKEGDLTEAQLKLLRDEPKISVIEIGN